LRIRVFAEVHQMRKFTCHISSMTFIFLVWEH
jgi:hypothetical protein